MKAVLLKRGGNGALRAEVSEVPVPSIGRGELLVEMKACGLCGTDIEKLRGEYTAAMPVVGHEAVGLVSEVGEGVSGLKVGDRIFPHHHVPCYSCYYCNRGDETACPEYKRSNLDPGGFSEYIRVPRWNVERRGVLPLPPDVGFEEGALIEPLACCIRALDECSVKPGDVALVVGAGPIGMMHALLLGPMEVRVMISDVVKSRLKFAEQASVVTALDAGTQTIPDVVRRETEGRGADLVIVASGSQRAVAQAMQSVRKGGTVCLFGVPVEGSVLDYELSKVYNSMITIRASYGAVETETARAISVISRRNADFRRLITHTFPLEEFEKGIQKAVNGDGMKVVITP
jgi:L-iditol 2-dehydrogenase